MRRSALGAGAPNDPKTSQSYERHRQLPHKDPFWCSAIRAGLPRVGRPCATTRRLLHLAVQLEIKRPLEFLRLGNPPSYPNYIFGSTTFPPFLVHSAALLTLTMPCPLQAFLP